MTDQHALIHQLTSPKHKVEKIYEAEVEGSLTREIVDLLASGTLMLRGESKPCLPAKLEIPFAAITAFVDPAVDFGLQFQATVSDLAPEPHDEAENDSPDADGAPAVTNEDGSNVVTIDFGRKK